MKNKADEPTYQWNTDREIFQNHLNGADYERTVAEMPVPILLHQAGVIVFLNEAACRLIGVSESGAVIGELVSDLLVDGLEDGERVEAKLLGVDGSVCDVQVDARTIILQDRTTTQLVLHDMTRQKKAEFGLQNSEKRYQDLFEHSLTAVFTLDMEGNFLTVNAEFQVISGYSTEELQGKPFRLLFKGLENEYWIPIFATLDQGIRQQYETKIIARDGRVVYLHLYCVPNVVHEEIVGLYGVVRNISEQKRAAKTILHLANHDLLTGLPNRPAFKNKLGAALRELEIHGGQLGLVYIDLDLFKKVNDTMGHSVGDQVLVRVSQRLNACIRQEDTLCRSGGDEFVILLPSIEDEMTVQNVANRILRQFQEPFRVGEHTFHLTCSIGVAIAPRHGTDAEGLMRTADIAMYDAKEKGKNNYQFFTQWLEQKVSDRFVLENELRQALKRDEFTLFYQPQVRIDTREVVGAEALIRWHHPERGMVSPGLFIPIAEETGLIVPIGDWVLQTVCEQAKQWQEQGKRPIRMFVNLSSRQFQEPTLIEKIVKTLRETGLDPKWLGLEITESMIMKDVEHAIHTLNELRDIGIQVAIDDFGTGYSSLLYLKKFPIDKLKIDQVFVRDLTSSRDDKAIVKTIISLAKNLNLTVIAEGVETEEQLKVLLQEKCDSIQGYLFGKPEPEQQFVRFLS